MPRERGRGRYVVDGSGNVVRETERSIVVPDGSELDLPLGPSVMGELLMVDIRVARLVCAGTRLHTICDRLAARGACGVISATLVVDLLDADPDEREFLLAVENWPTL